MIKQIFYFASGLPVVYDGDPAQPVNNRLHTGKEYLSFEGLHWYDNHARMYDPLLMRFTTPDPLAAQFPSVSPYAYCNNNPINRIDPTGLSDFQIDQNGFIAKVRDTDSDYHTIYASNNDGSINNQTFINVSKALLESKRIYYDIKSESSAGYASNNITVYNTSKTQESVEFFEFAAQNSKVEWSHIQSTDGNVSKNYIGTTNDYGSDVSLEYISLDIVPNNFNILQADHNHPNGSQIVSNGDVRVAKSIQDRHPNARMNILTFDKKGKLYKNFNSNTQGATLDELIVIGNHK